MNDFKEGDNVWFFWTYKTSEFWGEYGNGVFPRSLNLNNGTIVYLNENRDEAHVYVRGDKELVKFGFCFLNKYVFRTKQAAIDAMSNRLAELDNE
jgi:hypothetical protein